LPEEARISGAYIPFQTNQPISSTRSHFKTPLRKLYNAAIIQRQIVTVSLGNGFRVAAWLAREKELPRPITVSPKCHAPEILEAVADPGGIAPN